tara:strand:+ start:970 stop:1476 length:507 start_codon:yes stop_codon:yes gene_type:complete
MYPEMVTLIIPIDSYLKKYLIKKYGSHHMVSRDSWLGRYFIEILDRQYKKKNISLKKSDTYTFVIPYYVIKEVGLDLPTAKMKSLAVMIEQIFYNDLYTYIEVSMGNQLSFINSKSKNFNEQNAYKATEQFLSSFDISEDELKLDSVYKRFYRDRISDKSKKQKKQIA